MDVDNVTFVILVVVVFNFKWRMKYGRYNIEVLTWWKVKL
jgi:hypothetical protein